MAACRYDDYDYDSAFASVFDCGDETDNDQPDFGDWNAGLVYARARGVTLCLINSARSQGKIKSRALHIKFERQAGMGFAVVDSNLYAFGALPGYDLQEFFVCDLNDSSPKFKRGGELLTPKLAPIVIPYYGKKKKKLFIIPCACFDAYNVPKNMSCEVVDLPCNENGGKYESRPLKAPFDKVYLMPRAAPVSMGVAVLGKYAYIKMSTRELGRGEHIVCLDMDAEEFVDPFSVTASASERAVTTIESEHDKACRSTFSKAIYGLWEHVNFVCRDKLFVVRWTLDSQDVKICVTSNLWSAVQEIGLENQPSKLAHLGLEHLKELEEFFCSQLEDFRSVVQAWTLPFKSKEENTFSMFICYATRYGCGGLVVCNFKLVDLLAETDSIDADAGKSSRYKCKILSRASYKDFLPKCHWFVHAFSSGGGSLS
ncbi:hypothetical protein LINGRAHAP2_LOCUS36325 [Linum grandiflorum]